MYEKIRNIIADELGIDASTIKKESHIIDDLNADSLDAVELIMAFEEAFGVEIDDDAAASLMTIQQIQDYLEANSK